MNHEQINKACKYSYKILNTIFHKEPRILRIFTNADTKIGLQISWLSWIWKNGAILCIFAAIKSSSL
jgi:hypothetical protein